MTITRLDSYEELLEASGHHPVVELDVGRGLVPPAWTTTTPAGTAVVFARTSDHGVLGAAVLGPAAAVDVLLGDERVRSWFEAGPFAHLSRPVRTHAVVERHLPVGDRGGDWDWMWTTTPPPAVPGEDRVEVLGPDRRDAVDDLLRRASPRTHGRPFADREQRWVGVDADGGLVACGCAAPTSAGYPVLSGIAVDPEARGRGLGTAVTAALTRHAVASSGACVLGMFSDNDDARRLYHRLGFATAVSWRSRWRTDAWERAAH